jgi:hypothetical protein
MDSSRNQMQEYRQFLSNPQKQGVWALSIQPDEPSVRALIGLLNLEEFHRYQFRYSGSDADEGHGVPSFIIPRLFAYLRYLTPRKQKEGLPPLFPSVREPWPMHRDIKRRRYGSSWFIQELTTEPHQLSAAKKRALAKTAGIYNSHFLHCTLTPVPERPSALDVVSHHDGLYFQLQEDVDGRITVYSLKEDTCFLVNKLIETLPGLQLTRESRKVFSPETQLLGMYMPLLVLVSPEQTLRDATVRRTISQTISEVREERFVHAIRAIGIGAEELIVEIFETYLHEKAPEAPLGNLLLELNSKVQEVAGGAKPRKKAPGANVKKALGGVLSAERKKPSSNADFCTLVEILLQGVMPSLDQLSATVADIENFAVRPQKTLIFPAHVNRALSDLVPLRNRVSHRVDRLSGAQTVTYLEAALALKSYIVLALWWQDERKVIDYRVSIKDAIKKAIERNKTESEEQSPV